jgi:hypothetical protein
MRERFTMRTLTVALTVTVLALFGLGGVAFAQQGTKGGAVKATRIDKVLDANPEPDGKAYRIELQLRGGKRVSYEISPEDATKIADGLSKPAIAGGQRQKVATLVYGMSVEVDTKGLAVVLSPRGRSGPLEPLAIPLTGAEPLVTLLQAKIAEARANAAKQSEPPKQP